MTNNTTNDAEKAPPMPDTLAPEAPVDPALGALDSPAQAQEATPGGEGVRAPRGGVLSIIHSDGENLALKEDGSTCLKKKSRCSAPAEAPQRPPACVSAAPAPEGRAEVAAAPAEAENAPPAPPPAGMVVFRLCHNPRLVLAKLDPRDPTEEPKALRVMRRGVLRVGMRVHGVPEAEGFWRQVRA